jgi:NAD(P)-dependent dehydrogenase (short-subunit alcohol dehydrogenase family)
MFFTVTVSVSMLAMGESSADSKAVLITGASSGIGKRTTQYLTSKGYFVYAGARKQKDMDALNAMKNVEAVRLDVTVQGDIDNAVLQISGGGHTLMGVVNNAGVAILAPLIELEESELDFLFDVNVYGPYRVTKAFAPMLIKNQGRVVNISSISGILSRPFFGAYSMSKHALEAYTDSLAAELSSFGVKVAAVEPGNYSSKIGASVIKRSQELGQTTEGSLYEKALSKMVATASDRDDMADPIAVAKAIEHALSADKPKARYMVVPNQSEAQWTIGQAMQEMVQLNQDQPYSYDRDTLVKMLDEALAM